VLLALLLAVTSSATEPGGARALEEAVELEPTPRLGWLWVIDGALRTPGGRIRLPFSSAGAVYIDPIASDDYAVAAFVDGERRELSWIEFYERIGDAEEVARRKRNSVLAVVSLDGGGIFFAGGVIAAAFVDVDAVRYAGGITACVGLLGLVLGFFAYDGAPEREEVLRLVAAHNAKPER
jgi:hypothetical protein